MESPNKARLHLATNPEANASHEHKEHNFWIIWNPKRGNPGVRHVSEDIARAEAERLAKASPGDQFYILEASSVTRMCHVETLPLLEAKPASPT